jgi:hypothetical protein
MDAGSVQDVSYLLGAGLAAAAEAEARARGGRSAPPRLLSEPRATRRRPRPWPCPPSLVALAVSVRIAVVRASAHQGTGVAAALPRPGGLGRRHDAGAVASAVATRPGPRQPGTCRGHPAPVPSGGRLRPVAGYPARACCPCMPLPSRGRPADDARRGHAHRRHPAGGSPRPRPRSRTSRPAARRGAGMLVDVHGVGFRGDHQADLAPRRP